MWVQNTKETYLRHQNLTVRTFLVSAVFNILFQNSTQSPHPEHAQHPQWEGGRLHLMSSLKLHNNPHWFLHQKSNVNVSDCSTAILPALGIHTEHSQCMNKGNSLEQGLLKATEKVAQYYQCLRQFLQTT